MDIENSSEVEKKIYPKFPEALKVWFKLGCISFGGPAGQIATLHTEIVVRRSWISESEFIRALQFCMLLPGPEAQQLATYIGWRLHGIRGGIAAGLLFFLPAAFLLWCLSLLYVAGQQWPLLHAFFYGLKPAVVAIVASACLRIGRRTITSSRLAFIALVALLLLILHIPYPVVVLGCGLLGFLLPPEAGGADLVATADPTKSDWRKSFRVALVIIGIWVLPVLGFFLWLGAVAMPLKIAFFYIRVSLFSFGGAYAALSYVSLHAVHNWGWVTQDQMIDGLGLAETTPGPLLIALQFVAFLAAYYTAGNLPPLLSATLGSLLALWSLFLPSFLWIFTFAPHLERIARNRRMEGALKAIGAVVTAVIAALAFWFAGSVFLKSGTSTFCVSWQPLIITIFCFLALRSTQVEIALLIVLSGVAGVFLKLVF